MHSLVAGGNLTLGEDRLLPIEVGGKATGLADQKQARRHVPG